MLEVGALAEQAVVGVPEGDEGAEQLCERPSHRDVVVRCCRRGCWRPACASWGRRRRGCGPTGGSSGRTFVEGRVQGDLAREDPHVFDGCSPSSPPPGRRASAGLCKLQLEHQVQLGRQELAGLEHPDERGRHQHVLEALRGHGCRHAPGDLPEARDPLVPTPFLRLE